MIIVVFIDGQLEDCIVHLLSKDLRSYEMQVFPALLMKIQF